MRFRVTHAMWISVPAITWLMFFATFGAATELHPVVSPGHAPEDTITEQGIWMELEDYENALRRSALLVKDKHINDYVQSVACKVVGNYCPDLRVYVIRNPGFNASMAANGVMIIWTGLLLRVSSEDELAAVIGHELAHYTQRHTLDRLIRIRKNMTAGSIFDFGLILLTGVSIPVGQMGAISSLMAFSREQEEEADLLGAQFMAESGYDPHASKQVWEMIVEEEKNAAVKQEKPGVFSRTHPGSEERIISLKAFVQEQYPDIHPKQANREHHIEMLNQNYMLLMEDQIDTNRFGRTSAMLDKHQAIGVDDSLVSFFRGEMYRQRNEEGDLERSITAYERAANGKKQVPEAHRNLGYIHLKKNTPSRAKLHFNRYLNLKPEADDRAMIEYYLKEIQP